MKYLHGQSTEMEKTHCNLKFDRHTYTFVNLLDYFRSKELYCDATIACDGKKYRVHQVVLSACSEFFANIFASTNCQNPMVVLQDVNRSHLESLLTYVYRGEVHVPQYELPDFVKVAKSLFIKGLMIPHLEKYQSPESLNGTWHDPYYVSEEEAARMQAVDPRRADFRGRVPVNPPPPPPRMQQHRNEGTPRPPSYQSHMQLNGRRIDDQTHKRQRVMHPTQYARQHDGRTAAAPPPPPPPPPPPTPPTPPHHQHQHPQIHHKRSHYMLERPQDLRIPELSHQRHNESNNADERLVTNQKRCEDKEPPSRSDGEASPRDRKRSRSSEKKEQLEDKRSGLYTFEDSRGTFQKLIAADEVPIKEEPIDPVIDCDTKAMDSLEKEAEDCKDYEEEGPLHISEDLNDMSDASSADPRSNGHLEPNNDTTVYTSNSEHMSRSATSVSPMRNITPPSQLRRELLRPLPLNNVHHRHQHQLQHHHQQQQQQQQQHQHPQTSPQSIPHPVIAPRESLQPQIKSHPQQPSPQHFLREPPPLMKIPSPSKMPSLISDSEIMRPHRGVIKDMPVSRNNSHLLVTAPPTYHSHNSSSNHLCFEIHNQQLGQVIVNGGPHIDISAPSCSHSNHSPPLNININKWSSSSSSSSNEGPLNLSGSHMNSLEDCGDDDNEDPFLGKIVTNRKKRLRGPKSWEFLVRLLKDPTTNPSLIRWENQTSGIFRLVQPSVIAQRWGRRTGKHANECLSYENFARGLRYHYATGALQPVSEKSFVYRFGPKALKLLEECDDSAFPYI